MYERQWTLVDAYATREGFNTSLALRRLVDATLEREETMENEDEALLTEMSPRPIGRYQAYTPNATPDQARAMFQARYGYLPHTVIVTGGAVLAGPIQAAKEAK